MKLLKTNTYEIKKSKFIAYLYEIEKKEDVSLLQQALKKEHKKAKHVPFAYFVDGFSSKSDDKEPSNSSGTPIYLLLERKEMRNHVIFVVRYFGGIKLGAGGLYRSYMHAAKMVLEDDASSSFLINKKS